MDIAIPIFDRITALDAVGPYEVLSRLRNTRVRFLAADGQPGLRRTDNKMLALNADESLEDLAHPEIMLLPGGHGVRPLLTNERLLDWIKEADRYSTYTTSVCSGALLLGAAGLLDGLNATTHWGSLEQLAHYGAVPTAERVVEQGKLTTAAGVSAGIDMALTLVERLAGTETAQAIQLSIEYDPAPPFNSGSIATASPKIVEMVRRRSGQLA